MARKTKHANRITIVLGALILAGLTSVRQPAGTLLIPDALAIHSLVVLHILIVLMMALTVLQLIGFHRSDIMFCDFAYT